MMPVLWFQEVQVEEELAVVLVVQFSSDCRLFLIEHLPVEGGKSCVLIISCGILILCVVA